MKDKITNLPFTENVQTPYPELGDESHFARQRGLKFGPLRITKEGFFANDGTVDTVKIDSSGFHGYDSAGTKTIRVSSAGIEGYGTAGNTFKFYDAEGGTLYGQTGYASGSNDFYWASENGAGVFIFSDENFLSQGTDSWSAVVSDGGSSYYFWDDSASTFRILDMNADKMAIMKTSRGYNSLYCIESPEVWFMDFCYGKKVFKKWWKFWDMGWELKPDKMFLEVTEKPYMVIPTGIKNVVQLWAKRRGASHKRFEPKTEKEFKENNKFWSTPTRKADKGKE